MEINGFDLSSDSNLNELNSYFCDKKIPVFFNYNNYENSTTIYFDISNMDCQYMKKLDIDPECSLEMKIVLHTEKTYIKNAGVLEVAISKEKLIYSFLSMKEYVTKISQWIFNPTHKCLLCHTPINNFYGFFPLHVIIKLVLFIVLK